ncbi:MAG: dihydroorotate dehydrogenase (quinone) [Proteobacteria bacterium]|nr:MAG: dihydroorotate dehydrogenase (quinone) [Pseudomonadota bacterium]PIE40261.1 MAG: dihydroorotate dehydrogenase (quinone) [Gammaproteobacteria bacterium]
MYQILRKLLFTLPAETTHELTLDVLRAGQRMGLTQRIVRPPVPQPVEIMGLTFNNPVGLAAGLDKNGQCIAGLAALGFGFVEIGTVTPVGQAGNPKPRLFRLPEEKALINRMGFNNLGVDALMANYEQYKNAVQNSDSPPWNAPIGINVGKNLTTSVEDAHIDYIKAIQAVYARADYITVNVSSPNTPGLRNLQFGEAMNTLLDAIKTEQHRLQEVHGRYVPIMVKIAPDMDDREIAFVADTFKKFDVDGIIATNTTIDRSCVKASSTAKENGGLSGAPLMNKSTGVVRALYSHLGEDIPIVAAGGITCAEDAVEKIRAGAKLVQIYTGFVYQGPGLIKAASDAILNYRIKNR